MTNKKSYTSKFLDIILNINKKETEQLYFRGEGGSFDYRLPTFYRPNSPYSENLILEGSKDYYRLLLSELGRDDYSNNSSLFGLLSELQHYGAVTRLLDITKNPLVALYFAVENDNKDSGFVHIYSVKKESEKFDTGHTVAIKSALNFIDQKHIDNFLEFCKNFFDKAADNKDTKKYNELNTDKIIKELDSNKIFKELNTIENKKNLILFMELLNQKARVREKLDYPISVYNDLITSHIVISSKKTDRIRQQQGYFIFPKYVNITDIKNNFNNNDIKDFIKIFIKPVIEKHQGRKNDKEDFIKNITENSDEAFKNQENIIENFIKNIKETDTDSDNFKKIIINIIEDIKQYKFSKKITDTINGDINSDDIKKAVKEFIIEKIKKEIDTSINKIKKVKINNSNNKNSDSDKDDEPIKLKNDTIEITAKYKKKLREELAQIGIAPGFIYPGIEHQSKTLLSQ